MDQTRSRRPEGGIASPNHTPKANPIETLLGGADFEVELLDGTKQTVRVRQLPISDYPKLMAAIDDESKQLELYCRQPEGWADSLKPEIIAPLIAKAEELNDAFFYPWVQRRLGRQERIMPGLVDRALGTRSPTTQQN